jgi:hypothetical protein
MRRPIIAPVALVVGAGLMSACGIGWASSSSPQLPAIRSASPAPSVTVRLYQTGDKTVTVAFNVSGPGRADVSYALHKGDTPTRLTVALPWEKRVEVGVDEPGVAPAMTARNTDPSAPIECMIVTNQFSGAADHAERGGVVAKCSVSVSH